MCNFCSRKGGHSSIGYRASIGTYTVCILFSDTSCLQSLKKGMDTSAAVNVYLLLFIYYFISCINISFYLTICKTYVEEQYKYFVEKAQRLNRTSRNFDLLAAEFCNCSIGHFGVRVIRKCGYIAGITVIEI